jgi:hypothetical protein
MPFLTYARQYHEAAEIVFVSKPSLTSVLYSLYFHTVELLLKAYLQAHGRESWGHEISNLYDEARQLGLTIEQDRSGSHNLHNVVALLEAGNAEMAFRYHTKDSRSIPDLAWTREVVSELMSAVTPSVESKWDKSKSGIPVKFDLTWRVQG